LKSFANVFGKGQGARRAGRTPAFRPQIEALEERALLSVGPQFHINTKVSLAQDAPEVASQPVANGRSVVVWRDQYNTTGDTDIRAQVYDGFGNKVGGEILVTASSRPENEPAVAMDAQGNFVVTWSERVNSTNSNIKAQRYFANGARNGTTIQVATSTLDEYDPSVAMDQSGNFVISYTAANSTNSDILARRYASNGALLGAFPVANSSATESRSSVARSPDGRFSIAYEVPIGSNENIVLKRYNATGGLLGTHTVGSDARDELQADVAMDRYGNTVVVWTLQYGGSDYDIKARKVYQNGFMDALMNIESSGLTDISPTVAMDLDDAEFVVAYNQVSSNGTNNLIVRELTGNGTLKSVTNLGPAYFAPALAINDSDVYFMAYTKLNDPTDSSLGIFGRRGLLA
jgi:hypothetical protein